MDEKKDVRKPERKRDTNNEVERRNAGLKEGTGGEAASKVGWRSAVGGKQSGWQQLSPSVLIYA